MPGCEERCQDDEAELRAQLCLEAQHDPGNGNEDSCDRLHPYDYSIGVDARNPSEVRIVGHGAHGFAELGPIEQGVDHDQDERRPRRG